MISKSSFSPPPGLTDDRTNDIVCWIHTLPHQATRQMHTHPFGEFFYCYAEGGTQIIPDGIIPMKVGDVYYFPPGQEHIGNGLPNANAQCIVLYLPTTVFSHLNNGDEDALRILQVLNEHVQETSNRIPLSRKGGLNVRKAMLAVIQEGMQGRPAYRCAAKVQLQQMLLTIMRDKALPEAWVQRFMIPDRDQRMTEVCRYMQTHFMHPIAVSQLASMCFLGLSQFHAIFKKEVGCSAVQYLTRIRMHHARQMLNQTQHGIAQIAQRCGYDCLGHFYDVFKTHYGSTPRQMRLSLTKRITN